MYGEEKRGAEITFRGDIVSPVFFTVNWVCSGTKGIRGGWRFSVKAGCRNKVFELKVFYVFVTDMVILAFSSLKVCVIPFKY